MNSARNIALFIDGTWDRPSTTRPTNVYKLFRASRAEAAGDAPQLTYYLPGVGHDIRQPRIGAAVGWYGSSDWAQPPHGRVHEPRGFVARRALGGVFGAGTAARIKEAYAFLCHHFVRDRGDRIYVFGFSRGALAARSLAGFVFRVGTLLANDLHLVEAAYAVYESGTDPSDSLLAGFLHGAARVAMLQSEDDRAAMPLHLVGLWDTVAAVGLPRAAARFTAERTRHHQTTPPLNVVAARHALALHELRADFAPALWKSGGHRNLVQLWFPGAHADVGGGYDLAEAGASNAALDWMANEAQGLGLQVDRRLLDAYLSTGDARLHNSLSGLFRAFAPTPRAALEALLDRLGDRPVPALDALGFHASVLGYLREPERWSNTDASSKVRASVAAVDRTVLQLLLAVGLLCEERRLVARHGSPPAPVEPADASRPSWWRTVALSELRSSGAVVAACRARLSEPFVSGDSEGFASPPDAELEPMARALVVQRLLANDATLAACVALADAASRSLARVLSTGADPRDDPSAVVDAHALATLHPLLERAAAMLDALGPTDVGAAVRAASKRARTVHVDYVVTPLRHGVQRATNVKAGQLLTPRGLTS